MLIDLHTHSRASDGTQSPGDVVALAHQVGLDVLGLTDHDSAAGWGEAAAKARDVGIMLVLGMEISTRHQGAGVHLLAYLPDPDDPALAAELGLILEGRAGRLQAMIGRLREAGLDISVAEVLRQVGEAPAIGRPHVADVLVRKGYAVDRGDAFARWLNSGTAGYVSRYATTTRAMIRIVTAAGGAAVIAHPWGRGSRDVVDLETLALFQDDGLVGIEVDHQDHNAADRRELQRIAADLGLVQTGSSDFHGAGKVDHELGCNVTDPEQFDRLLEVAARNAAASGRLVPEIVRA
ncbi:MAG: PHP domain-containing protein [Propionibacteriales bacterium]|nr:PHP domain-containing protein [Propionibacteriales bacterium]